MAAYIEREKLMQKFADHVKRSNNSDFAPVPTWNQAVQIVEDSPAADVVERKHGKWVGRSENDCYPVCSECGRTRLGSSLGYCQKYVPFCEHCGADMRGEDDENEN